ncbi:MAG: PHP domain-containing protein [Oscillospiraceae bacterium]|nr:PHP domain-containing protein [Oscillospiraceae bacterium]
MDRFICEMHAHTSNTSRCAHVSAEEMIDDYVKARYDGIVVTDHLSPSTYARFEGTAISWKEKVDFFLQGYKAALKAADNKIKVFLGMEIRFYFPEDANMNDYLVYGVTEKFLYDNVDIDRMRIPEFSELVHKNGMAIFQAHPFRTGMTITNPKYLDGIEVYNGCPRHNSRNEIANIWADTHSLLKTSGSDFHQHEDTALGGLIFDREIGDNKELVKALLTTSPEIIRR